MTTLKLKTHPNFLFNHKTVGFQEWLDSMVLEKLKKEMNLTPKEIEDYEQKHFIYTPSKVIK